MLTLLELGERYLGSLCGSIILECLQECLEDFRIRFQADSRRWVNFSAVYEELRFTQLKIEWETPVCGEKFYPSHRVPF